MNTSWIVNPIAVYVSVWLFILGLFEFNLLNNFVEIPLVGILVIFSNIITIFLAFYVAKILTARTSAVVLSQSVIHKFINILLIIWGVGTCIDIIYSGGVPFFWAYGSGDKNYIDFGVPSLHGFVNACYLSALTLMFFCWNKERMYIYTICALLIWPVLMLGREVFLSAVVQMCAVYLLMNRLKLITILWVIVLILILTLLFGMLGDFRQGGVNPHEYLVKEDAKDFFSHMPSGFLWVYVYATGGLNNFFANVDQVIPVGFPLYSISNMLPSVVRIALNVDSRNDSFEFVDSNLNTSTVYAGPVSDFGPLGGVIFVYIIQQIACIFYFKAKSNNVGKILAYSIMFHVLLFSVFYDMFFLLRTLMQLCIALLFDLFANRKFVAINSN